MPPQAGGFRYTPTSYLQKTTREENRPWNDTTGHEDDDQFHIVTRGQAAIKKGSRDAHFQNRVAKKKNAYRALLKRGDDNSEATGSSNVSGMDDFSNDNFYGNPDTYFDNGYGSVSTGSDSYGVRGRGDIYYGSTNESSNSSYGGHHQHHALPPHSRAYTETCNRYSDVSSVRTEEVPAVSTQPDTVSPSMVKVAARVARQKRIQEESKQHRLAEARFLERKQAKELEAKSTNPKRQVSASPARYTSGSEQESSNPVSHERQVRAYRNRRIMEASEDERERLEELRERRAREEEQAARRRAQEIEKENAEKKRREDEKNAKIPLQPKQRGLKKRDTNKDNKKKQNRSKQLEKYERAQREAAAAAERAAEEDRKTQEVWRQSSLELLQEEKREQRAKASPRSRDNASRRSRGSRSSGTTGSSKTNSIKAPSSSARGRTRTRSSTHELPTNGEQRPLDGDEEPTEMTLMDEFHELLRESGFFRTCVSSCFGEEVDLEGAPCGGEDTSQSSDSSSPIEL